MSFVTYASYLQLDPLLNLQQRLSAPPEHDEMLFIVIHQVYELWFKQLLHETEYLCTSLGEGNVPRVMHTMRRQCTILKTLVAQVDILETMTPLSFNSFREHLKTSSGFQSCQFRQLEFLLGKRNLKTLEQYPLGTPSRVVLENTLQRPCVYDLLLQLLARRGFPIGPEALQRDTKQSLQPNGQVQEILIDIYRHHPELSQLCERFVDIDEGFSEWRYRHVQMVQRTIGVKIGTGGSPGAEYLKSTLFKPFFPDLWEIRQSL